MPCTQGWCSHTQDLDQVYCMRMCGRREHTAIHMLLFTFADLRNQCNLLLSTGTSSVKKSVPNFFCSVFPAVLYFCLCHQLPFLHLQHATAPEKTKFRYSWDLLCTGMQITRVIGTEPICQI
jgi:uncharacterized membrane protein